MALLSEAPSRDPRSTLDSVSGKERHRAPHSSIPQLTREPGVSRSCAPVTRRWPSACSVTWAATRRSCVSPVNSGHPAARARHLCARRSLKSHTPCPGHWKSCTFADTPAPVVANPRTSLTPRTHSQEEGESQPLPNHPPHLGPSKSSRGSSYVL